MPSSAKQNILCFIFISSCFKLSGLEFVSSLDCKKHLCRRLLRSALSLEQRANILQDYPATDFTGRVHWSHVYLFCWQAMDSKLLEKLSYA